MENISVLDCTLRDGFRIVDCNIPDSQIIGICDGLVDAGIDIIEVGFLRDGRNVLYKGDSTFFTDVGQINDVFQRKKSGCLYVAFIDFHMFDFSTLQENSGNFIDGIRFGFTRKDYLNCREEIIENANLIKRLGYKLFFQPVNALGYSDEEYISLINEANRIQPFSFAIVDTYGAMYEQDLAHYYNLVYYNLDSEICIDFHSHNNFQLSFALAQALIDMNRGRSLIIDATLSGIGKVAGNLNTELITNFLNNKKGFNYDEDKILDIIDEYLYKYSMEYRWGYSIPGLIAGQLQSHPNNIIYLTQKNRLNTKAIKYVLSMIEPSQRQRYDYELIDEKYVSYNSAYVDDKTSIEYFNKVLKDKDVLLIGPGKNLDVERENVLKYVQSENCIIISINFVCSFIKSKFVFFGSEKRYLQEKRLSDETVILTSNIPKKGDGAISVNYVSLIECGGKHFDNSFIMIMNLLVRSSCKNIMIAGVDGFNKTSDNYLNNDMEYGRDREEYEEINKEVINYLRTVKKTTQSHEIRFITSSIYRRIFD